MKKTIISWDLGATKCAAGVIEYDPETAALFCKNRISIKLTDTASLEDLIEQIEMQIGFNMSAADAICISAAGHYDGSMLVHENPYPYAMPFAKIAKQFRWPTFSVIHDYAPIVCATFTSYINQKENITHLNNYPINSHGRRVALGVGTGLGIKDGVLFPNGDFWLGKNEAGHIGVNHPPMTNPLRLNRHKELMHFLTDKIQKPITFENILSGPGTVHLHQFFYPHKPLITPEEVGDLMRDGQVDELQETFAWYLGLFIGTLQLIFMPEGGIWMTGGVALSHLEIFEHPEFELGIHSSPAYLLQRQQYPLAIMHNQEHALIGGAYYATKRLLA